MPKILRGEEDSFADILKNITQKCLFADCNRIILVNSRPSGFLYPTDEDVDFVKKLAKTYSSLAIELVDCLFVCGKNVTFMSSMNAVPYILWKYILR
jgi:DNA repair protein RadC